MEKTVFTATLTGMMSAFLIWAAHFAAVYGINGLICARGWDGVALYGHPVAVVLVLGATAVALLLAAAVCGFGAWVSRNLVRRGATGRARFSSSPTPPSTAPSRRGGARNSSPGWLSA